MSTGLVDNWLNIDTFEPIYPFVGTEGLLVFLGIAFWIGWHVFQIMEENEEFRLDIKNIQDNGGVDKFLANELERGLADMSGK